MAKLKKDYVIKLEGMRLEMAKYMWADSLGKGKVDKWMFVQREVREGFEKLAGVALACMFRQRPEDIIDFFVDGRMIHEDIQAAILRGKHLGEIATKISQLPASDPEGEA